MGILDSPFGNKKNVKGLGQEIFKIAIITATNGEKFRQLIRKEEISDDEISSVRNEEFLANLSIGLYWVDIAYDLKRITEEEYNEINSVIVSELRKMVTEMREIDPKVKPKKFYNYFNDRIDTYRRTYHKDFSKEMLTEAFKELKHEDRTIYFKKLLPSY